MGAPSTERLRSLDRRAHRPQTAWQKGAAADHPAHSVAVPLDCGQRRDLTATQALRAPKRCRPCAIAHVCLPSHIVERWIEACTEGQSWRLIASADGRSIPTIYRGIYLYLRRNDRLDEIPLIWGPKGKVGWLRRFHPRRGTAPPPLARRRYF